MSRIAFQNSIPGPWTYVDVTEIRAEQDQPNRWTLSLVLWTEDCTLDIVGESLRMNGHVVVAAPDV